MTPFTISRMLTRRLLPPLAWINVAVWATNVGNRHTTVRGQPIQPIEHGHCGSTQHSRIQKLSLPTIFGDVLNVLSDKCVLEPPFNG
jgi:hypothetical protein